MPNLIGFSLKSAQTYLKVLGLRMGSINLVTNRNKNVIVDQLVGANPIAPGIKISSGTMINFTVGDGGNGVGIEVPDLIGMTVEMAKSTISDLGLLLGNIISSAVIQDTANAFVIQQTPNPFSAQLDSLGMPIRNSTIQGGSIDLIIDKVAPIVTKKDSIK
jgi:beta-lactam-binding protein with PASTA domain